MTESAPKTPIVWFASLAAILLGGITAYIIRGVSGVHFPLLAAIVAGIIIGFIDPKTGWVAAIVQSVVVSVGTLLIGNREMIPDIEIYSLAGAVGLTFVGSFLGAYMKRALDS